MFESIKAEVTLTFTRDLLGSTPKDKDVYATYIEELKEKRIESLGTEDLGGPEVDTVPAPVKEEGGWTGFHGDESGLFIYDYVVKGFLKESARLQAELYAEKGKTPPPLRSKIDHYWFVTPRKIRIVHADGSPILKPDDTLSRPLRASTPQGMRVCLAKSDVICEGSKLTFALEMFDTKHIKGPEQLLESLLKYGKFKGLGQWRNAGYGAFTSEIKFEK